MEYAITREIDLKASHKRHVIKNISNAIKTFLSNKDYGDGLQHFYIGCICIRPRPGYEDWFKVRRPRYYKKTTVESKDGSKKVLYGV